MAYAVTSDIHAYGNIPTSDTSDDAYFSLLIGRATTAIDQYTGRKFETSSDAEVARYYSPDDVDGLLLYLDEDLAQIITVTVGSDSVTSTDYFVIPRNAKPYYALRLKDNSPRDWGAGDSDGEYHDSIVVTGQWGYSTTAPADIKHATCRLVRWMFEMGRINPQEDRPIVLESGTTILPGRMPNDVTSILDRYKKVNVHG